MNSTEMINLFEKIYTEAYDTSKNSLESEVNGQKLDLQSIHWKVKEKIESVNNHEKTSFLTVPILEDTFSYIYPLLLFPAEEIVSGDLHRVNDILELQKAFKESPVKELWRERKTVFNNILRMMQLETEDDIYNDLSDISEILMKALLFFEGHNGRMGAKIYQYTSGNTSSQPPKFANDISIYTCANDFVQALKKSPSESLVAFGAVRMTESQTNDYFYDYINGYDNERTRNYLRHMHMTKEEYFASENKWKRMVYLGIKNGQNIYLVESSCGNSNSYPNEFYCYGDRKSYFPYQILFDTSPIGKVEKNQLAVIKDTWRLQDILDDEQRVYIPVLLGEVMKKFYSQNPVQLELTIAPQTTILQIADKYTENTLVCHTNDLISFSTISAEVLFSDEPWVLTLLNAFNITENDIADAPLLPTHDCLEKEHKRLLHTNIANAYRKVIKDKLKALSENEDRTKMIESMLWGITKSSHSRFRTELESGKYVSFSDDIVNGITGTTEKDDSNYMYRRSRDFRFVLTYDSPVDYRPPVCIKVRPKTKADLIKFYSLNGQELPFQLKYRDEILSFYSNPNRESYGLINLPGINVLMKKKTYKQTLEKYVDMKDKFELRFSGKDASKLAEIQSNILKDKGFVVTRYYRTGYETIKAERSK